jgi:RNA polymerase sigma factor (sigma-70 family)
MDWLVQQTLLHSSDHNAGFSGNSKKGYPVMPPGNTSHLQACLDRFRAGDPAARHALWESSYERLRKLTHQMLRHFPVVRLREETLDVLHKVWFKLDKMLDDVDISSARDYFRLANTHIQRRLIELARRYGRQHVVSLPAGEIKALTSEDLDRLEAWAEFHEQIARLPDEEREVFGLRYYQDLPEKEAAEILDVSTSTIRRRWRSARLRVANALKGNLPY